MEKILIVNAGSSSLRVGIFSGEKEIASLLVSGIGLSESHIKCRYGEQIHRTVEKIKDHHEAFDTIISLASSRKIIEDRGEIQAVGHRVVHGGAYFTDSVIINDDVLYKIQKCVEIAPLHNPVNLLCINVAQKYFSNINQVAIFDTAFHQTIPEINYLYAIPKKYTQKYNIRKYGFHGSSHKYMSQKVIEISKKSPRRVITCHVGGGASIAAILDGKSINTSMGFTPLDGLVMGTRSGELDPGVVLFLQDKENLSPEQLSDILNKESGILGLTGVTGDLIEIKKGVEENNLEYIKALEIYTSRIARYIAGYITDLGGVDAIVFTGGVLENSPSIRQSIAEKFNFIGLELDPSVNNFKSEERKISTQNSKVELFVIPMQEELMMLREVQKLITLK